MKVRHQVGLLVGLSLFFWLIGVRTMDPDFGWYVEAGKQYIKSGLSERDLFSYTMPGYRWVDNGKGMVMVIYWLYINFGYEITALVFGLIGALALWMVTKEYGWEMAVIPLLLALNVFGTRAGIRTQVIDWLMTALVLSLFEKGGSGVWLAPVVVGIWANLHGGFVIGWLVSAIYTLGRFLVRKDRRIYLMVTGLVITGTLINPYGIRLWSEVWRTGTILQMKTGIVEWLPVWTRLDVGLLGLMMAVVILLAAFRNMYKLEEKLTGLMFGVMAIGALRFGPIFCLWAIPAVAKGLGELWKNERGVQVRSMVVAAAFLIMVIELRSGLGRLLPGRLSAYPTGGVEFMKKNPIEGNLFAEYRWGGYLIWELPQKKTFVDGRMPTWVEDGNKDELKSAFATYQSIRTTGKYFEVFSKFDINSVMLLNPETYGEDVLVNSLKTFGWTEVYKDGLTVILRRGA